jgi:hypothetical protein
MNELVEVTRRTSNPLEEIMRIEPNSTEVVSLKYESETIEYEEFDDKENELDTQYQAIHDIALTNVHNLGSIIEDADTKLVARLMEVQNQLLGTAMSAISQKRVLKENKDKAIARANQAAGKAGGNTTNNIAFMNMSQADALAMLREQFHPENTNVIEGNLVTESSDD